MIASRLGDLVGIWGPGNVTAKAEEGENRRADGHGRRRGLDLYGASSSIIALKTA